MRLRALAVAGLALVLVGCGSSSSTAHLSAGAPTDSALPIASPTQPAITAVYLVSSRPNQTVHSSTLHVVTARGGVAADRVVASANGYRVLLTAGAGVAVVLDVGAVDGSDSVEVVDLLTGNTRS